jgi:hypothetical protein
MAHGRTGPGAVQVNEVRSSNDCLDPGIAIPTIRLGPTPVQPNTIGSEPLRIVPLVLHRTRPASPFRIEVDARLSCRRP